MAWWGDDKAITKAITCAERIKKQYPSILYQTTKIFYNCVIEKYEPLLSNLENIEVTRNIPTIVILLSKSEFNYTGLPYQTTHMSIIDIVYNSTNCKALKVLKKVKRKENYNNRLQNSISNKN